MNKKNFFSLLLLSILSIVLLLVLSSHINKRFPEVRTGGGILKEGTEGTPRFINPVLARPKNASEQDLTELIFSRLLSHKKNGSIVYGLAKSLKKEDEGKSYILTLKEGISFHDGHPITADDVVYTIKKIQDPSINSPLFNYWTGVEVKKENDRQIRFNLVHAYDGFPYSLEIGILPKHLWEEVADEEFAFSKLNRYPVGSGHYKIKEILFDKENKPIKYALEKRKGGDGYIENVELSIFNDTQSMREALAKGNIDAVYGIERTFAEKTVEKKHNLKLYHDALPNLFMLFYNTSKKGFSSQRLLRNYLDSLIQREDIVKDIFKGYASPINTSMGNYEKEDLKKRREKIEGELKKKGWKKNAKGIYEKDGKELSFTITTRDNQELIRVAKEIAREAKEGGVEIKIKPYDMNQKEFVQQIINQRNYELLLYGYFYEKPSDLFAFWHSSQRESPGLNLSMYSNPKLDIILEKLREYEDPKLEKEMESILHTDTPASFLYKPHYIYVLPKKIKGVNLDIRRRADRFISLPEWYIYTRKVWPFFIKE